MAPGLEGLVRAERGDGDRNLLDILHPALGRHGDFRELVAVRGRVRGIRVGRRTRQQTDDGTGGAQSGIPPALGRVPTAAFFPCRPYHRLRILIGHLVTSNVQERRHLHIAAGEYVAGLRGRILF